MNYLFSQKIYYIKDVEQIVGRNRLTLRRMWTTDRFPKPDRVNNRLAWHSETIKQWIKQTVQEVRHEKETLKQSM